MRSERTLLPMKGLNKKSIVLTVLALATVLITVLMAVTGSKQSVRLESEEERRSYISSLGVTISEEPPAIRNIVIPSEFSTVYKKYNEIQKEAGFDLWDYRGEFAVQYTYIVTNYKNDKGENEQDVRINLILFEGKLIGGDISSTRLDGFMKGLRLL